MKTIQIISKMVAREKGIDEKEADRVNDFFWKEVRKKLSGLESTSVSIKHIGTITTSKRKIDFYIRSTIRKIRNIKKSTRYKESTIALLLEVNLTRLRKALVQRNILATQYYEAYTKRHQRVYKTNSADNGELGVSIRGSSEPSEDGIQYAPGA